MKSNHSKIKKRPYVCSDVHFQNNVVEEKFPPVKKLMRIDIDAKLESNKFLPAADIISFKKNRNSDESYQCIQCKKSFFNKRYLDSHNRLIHKTKNMIYSDSSSVMEKSLYNDEMTSQNTEVLLQTQLQDEDFKCNLCDIRFSTEDNLNNHYNLIHNQFNSVNIVSVYSVENLLVNKSTFSGNYQNVDIHSTESIVPLPTDPDNISIKTEASLYMETDVSKPELSNSLCCNCCEKNFQTEHDLKMHTCHNLIQEMSIKIEPMFSDESSDELLNASSSIKQKLIQSSEQQSVSTEKNEPFEVFKNVQVKCEKPDYLECNVVNLDKSYLCSFCDLSFHTEYQRNMHSLHNHMQEKLIKKEITLLDGTIVQDFSNLSKEGKYEQTQPFEQHNFPGESEGNKSSLQDESPCNNHINTETPTHTESILVKPISDPPSCHCAFCGQNFPTEHELKIHCDLNHNQEKNAKINPSFPKDNLTARVSSLGNSSLDSQDSALEKTLECGPCKMYFESRYFLKKHLREHHAEEPTHECIFCCKKFVTDSQLVFHLRTHTKAKQSCTICGKSYGQVSYMHRHLLTHSNCKPYGCLLCGLKFLEKSNLKKHYQKFH
ncbi:hypothetical protein NPIL_342541 [Nephila pilipes]|uniref:C2H2-type domain-containing protein n=1 Tax=Nephila pilipes TaxID=299642 RepID=A0A8X6U8U9_NEPPI|nr:hypothetical protein NPIL_342541 [Nephila pilipes]